MDWEKVFALNGTSCFFFFSNWSCDKPLTQCHNKLKWETDFWIEIKNGLFKCKRVINDHWTQKEEITCMFLCWDCTFYKDVLVTDCWVVYFYSLNIWKHSIFIRASFHEFTASFTPAQELNITETTQDVSWILCHSSPFFHTTASPMSQNPLLTRMTSVSDKRINMYSNKYLTKLW